ncbi:hypothetical protein [Nostoc sp. C117]|uniref:hypothetical protein n=1 Tax=Nostoc sp. C117 TaxID=3349875 RepID=UPI00370CFEA9
MGRQGGQGDNEIHETPNSARAKRPAIANRTPNAQCPIPNAGNKNFEQYWYRKEYLHKIPTWQFN